MPNLYIISGCNGAGKTTASYTMLPEMLECKEFINADEIAKGLSPFQPEKASIEAGRIMIRRMEEMLRLQQDFAIETTLATKSYVSFIKKAQKVGYFVTLLYFWLSSPELAIKRVEDRVKAGGHHVPQDVIRRRYRAGAQNLFTLYTPIADYWLVVNNSENPFRLVAEGKRSDMIEEHNEEILNQIKNI
ncbi:MULTISPECIES: zeta toxin family protein [unclassified Dysgonomonas]|uniref:zeta toxin family protein n=1 Tax=unclassified Dysgonomonas TaxID=2630389 RepID=UPI000680DF0E|nr:MULTISPECIES: zeta toxin family protein [unclassified Dysgonomonas]MBD8347215.1 zeta toxin family protein [Dysgonomonas sp. HGC4]MBF0574975.1 zeta toxin family protein [Dysgonomonas sp. GY617]